MSGTDSLKTGLRAAAFTVSFVWNNPLYAFVIVAATYAVFAYARHKWRARRALHRSWKERRRRAGIPDSDSRPWLIARPAAELRRRQEVKEKAKAEAAAAEEKRLQAKKEEVEEWGQGALKTLQRLNSSGHFSTRAVARRRVRDDEDDDFWAQESIYETGSVTGESTGPAWAGGSPTRPHSALPPVSSSRPPRTLSRTASRTVPGPAARPPSRLPSSRLRVQKRGRGESDSEEEIVRPRKTGRAKPRRTSKAYPIEDEEMPSDEDFDEDFDQEMDEDELEMMEEEAMDDEIDEDIVIDETPTTRPKRSRQEEDEPRKRARKSPSIKELSDMDVTPQKNAKEAGASIRSVDGTPVDLPVYGSPKASYEAIKQWTDAAGVEWFQAVDGTRYRQEDIRVETLKYKMPRDSEHPDARTEADEHLRVWVEEKEYDMLKAQNRLKWQKDLHQSKKELKSSKQTSPVGSETPDNATPSRPSSAASTRSAFGRSRSHVGSRIGLSNSVTNPKPESPYYTNSAAFDRQLASPSRSRLNSPARFAGPQRRQFSEAGRAKRHDDLLAKLGGEKEEAPAPPAGSATAAAPSFFNTDKPAATPPVPSSLSKMTTPAAPSPLRNESVSEKKSEPAPFSFGSTPSEDKEKGKDKPASAAPFSFGTSSTTADKSADKPEATSTPKAPFSFGTPAEKKEEPSAKAGFSFGTPASTEKSADPASKPFSFGTPTTPAAPAGPADANPADKPSFSFGTTASAPAADKPAAQPFSFGTPAAPANTPDKPADKSALSFGSSSASASPAPAASFSSGGSKDAKPADTPAKSASTLSVPASADKNKTTPFSFGASSAAPVLATTPAPPETPGLPTPSTGFSFSKPPETPGLPSSSTGFSFSKRPETPGLPPPETPGLPSSSTGFSFSKPAETPSLSSSTGFSFSKPAETPGLPTSSTGFSFGTSKPAESTDAPKPTASFGFGAPKPADTPGSFGKPFTPSAPSSFSFGSSPAPASTQASKPAVSFGSSVSAATPGNTSFSFGGTGSSAAASSSSGSAFGSGSATTEQKPAATFGGFGSAPGGDTKPSTPSFSFGTSASSAAGNTTSTPSSFSFGSGASAAPSASTFAFGAPAANAASTASPGFSFGASTPTPPASASTPSFSFGASPAGGTSGFSFGTSSPADGGRPIASLRRRGAK